MVSDKLIEIWKRLGRWDKLAEHNIYPKEEDAKTQNNPSLPENKEFELVNPQRLTVRLPGSLIERINTEIEGKTLSDRLRNALKAGLLAVKEGFIQISNI